MKANELRIGNLIQDKKDREVTIVTVAFVGEGTINYWMESVYQPISLTPDWLERFGFKYYKHKSDTDDSPITEEWSYANGLCGIVRWDNDGKFWLSNSFSFKLRVQVTTVHQLQNLIFAITGKELSLSLTSLPDSTVLKSDG